MSDRLDDKITAFVVELVDDPPPAPDIDVDAARRGQLVEPTVPRFRLRDAAVAAAAFVAVVAVIGVLALVPWSSDSEPQQPITTTPPPTTTVPFYPSTWGEMLRVEDLPAAHDWVVFDEATHAETSAIDNGSYIAGTGWNVFEDGVVAVQCVDNSFQFWQLVPELRGYDGPSLRLHDPMLKAMFFDRAVVGEALYVGSANAVNAAFNTMKSVTVGCFDGEEAEYNRAGGNAERLAMPSVGDDSIAIRVKDLLGGGTHGYDIFRLAIVRDGTRLLIVEEHETVASQDDPPRISDLEFTAIVQTAANRLKP